MAGPFTHMLVCQAAQHALPVEARKILAANQCFLLLGSVSPDLPAVADRVHGANWSDAMHDGKLTRTPVSLFAQLKQVNCRDGRIAWLLGYIGHLVADVVIHPVVRLAIQRWSNQNIHQRIEITQDTILFDAIKSWPLRSADFLGWLNECGAAQRQSTYKQAMDSWAAALKASDPTFDGNCLDWFAWYVHGFEAATDIPRWFFYNYIYPPIDRVPEADRRDFYDDVLLPVPAAGLGDFRSNVFDLAVSRTEVIWKKVWDRLAAADGSGIDDLIPDWDLNSGKNRTTNTDYDLWVAP
jgi:hypothetical protein